MSDETKSTFGDIPGQEHAGVGRHRLYDEDVSGQLDELIAVTGLDPELGDARFVRHVDIQLHAWSAVFGDSADNLGGVKRLFWN